MTLLATRLANIKPSPTLGVQAKANALKAEGRNIIALGTGEPDFNTPDFIIEAAYDAMKKGQTKYTAVDGMPALKKAIQAKFKNDNDLDYDVSQIMVGAGGKQIIFNAIVATVQKGDEVVFAAPFWVSYMDIVYMAEGTSVVIECGLDQNYKLRPEQLDRAITPKTKWVVLNSPNNPTGAAYTKAELRALADVLLKHPHVLIMADDVYEYLCYDDFEFTTIAQIEPRLYDRTLTVNALSKSYSMTGWRLGYGAGPKDLIKAMTNVQSHATSNPSSVAQAAGIVALQSDRAFLKEWLHIFQERRDMAFAMINATPGLSCPKPEGAFYLYVNCQPLIGKTTPQGKVITNDEEFVTYLLEAEGVACVHGAAFGLSPFFRISYAVDTNQLRDACERIRKACAALNGESKKVAA